MKRLAPLILALLALPALAQTTRPVYVGPFGQHSAPVGADGKRYDNFAAWRARGCNTLFVLERTEDRTTAIAAAKRAGLRYFLSVPFVAGTGSPDLLTGTVDVEQLRRDDADPDCLGWALPDEYDRGAGTVADAQRVAAVVRGVSRKVVFWNFTGQSAGLGGAFGRGAMRDRVTALLACCDVAGFDFHLIGTGRRPLLGPDGKVEGSYLALWLRLLDLLNELAPGKPVVVCVESGRQNVDARKPDPPTPDEYETMVRVPAEYAKAKGYAFAGVMIFPQKLGGGFQYDSTPDDVAAVMPAVHARYVTGVMPAPVPTPTERWAADVTKALDAAQAESRDLKLKVESLSARIDALVKAVDATGAPLTVTITRTPTTRPAP